MRRGNQGKMVHRLEDGRLLGVNLGADYTAEHECGIAKLRRTYGINDDAEGLERRKITRVPNAHILSGDVKLSVWNADTRRNRKETWHALVSLTYPIDECRPIALTNEQIARWELHPFGDAELFGAWDERSFGLIHRDASVVSDILAAIHNCDLCIGIFGGDINPFSRPGLNILIASRIPDQVKTQWLESDRASRRLKAAADATGIAERLKAANKNYFALSPRWKDDIESGEVIYWLNPCNQQDNNFGWYTVKDLDDWIKGRGPIPKKAAA